MQFCSQVGLPVSLAQLGVQDHSRESLKGVAARASAPGETAHNEPFAVDADLLLDAIMAADALGSQFAA